jgi:hypothetical protein
MEHLHAGASVAFTIPVKARTPVEQRKSRMK